MTSYSSLISLCCRAPSTFSLKDVTGLGRLDQRVVIGLQKIASRQRMVGGRAHRGHIAVMRAVTLLQRKTRIADGRPLRLGCREGDHPTDVVADLARVEAGRGDVPTEVGPQRRIAQHGRHTTEFVAVGVDARDAHRDRVQDRGRNVGRYAGGIDRVELQTPVVIEDRIEKFSGAKMVDGMPGIPDGKPIAAWVGWTKLPPVSVG